MDFYQFSTPLGAMALASEGDFITRLYLPGRPTPRLASHPTPLLLEGERQLLEYLGGQRKTFDLPLNPQGTPFQRWVWQALEAIPWGELRSYRDIAQAANCPGGSGRWAWPTTITPFPSSSPATGWWARTARSPATPEGWS